MKRFYKATCLCLMIALLAGLAGCGSVGGLFGDEPTPAPTAAPVVTAPAETAAPVEQTSVQAAPATTACRVRADIGVVFATYMRGDVVQVTGSYEDFYVVEIEGTSMYVDKDFIRLSYEAVPDTVSFTAKAPIDLYADAYLTGEPIATLKKGAKVVVLDSFGGYLFLSSDGVTGYTTGALSGEEITLSYNSGVKQGDISGSQVSAPHLPNGGTGSGGNSGGSGGSSGGGTATNLGGNGGSGGNGGVNGSIGSVTDTVAAGNDKKQDTVQQFATGGQDVGNNVVNSTTGAVESGNNKKQETVQQVATGGQDVGNNIVDSAENVIGGGNADKQQTVNNVTGEVTDTAENMTGQIVDAIKDKHQTEGSSGNSSSGSSSSGDKEEKHDNTNKGDSESSSGSGSSIDKDKIADTAGSLIDKAKDKAEENGITGTDAVPGGLSTRESGRYVAVASVSGTIKPMLATGTVLTDNCGAYLCFYTRGDHVNVMWHDSYTCLIEVPGGGYGSVDPRLVQYAGQEDFTIRTLYAENGAVLYSNLNMTKVVTTLGDGAELTVLDAFDRCVLVEMDGCIGYVPIGMVRTNASAK